MLPKADPSTLGFCPRRLERMSAWMARYIDAGKLPGATTMIAREGQVVFLECQGQRDVEAGLPLAEDSILRFYSMTKPVISVAIMMLLEEGLIRLEDPLARFEPDFADMSVYAGGEGAAMETEPARGPITLHHLLMHTSGLTYGFMDDHPVALAYRAAKLDFDPRGSPLDTRVKQLATLPLRHHPGDAWAYSVSFDVLGRVIEVVSGEPLDQYLATRIFEPLGMVDTAFHVPTEKLDRFAALYGPSEEGGIKRLDGIKDSKYGQPATCFSGGGGLLSTLGDYFRFTEMLRCGGAWGGTRLLGPRTLDFMTMNHLPEGRDLAAMGQPRFSETSYHGIGFGLGVSVVLDPGQARALTSPGEFAWGGAASTAFWVDPLEEIVVIFLTQLLPSSTYPIRQELRALTYQALVD